MLTRFHPYFSKSHMSEKGHNLDEKKIRVSYFFMRNPCMKFQNSSMHDSNVILCIKKHAMYKYSELQRAITHYVFFRICSKVNQVIYSSIPIYSPGFKALASIVFEIFCWQYFIHIFSKGHNSGKGHNPDGKKISFSYFIMRNPYMKFQNPSMHGSEVVLCIKKHAM